MKNCYAISQSTNSLNGIDNFKLNIKSKIKFKHHGILCVNFKTNDHKLHQQITDIIKPISL